MAEATLNLSSLGEGNIVSDDLEGAMVGPSIQQLLPPPVQRELGPEVRDPLSNPQSLRAPTMQFLIRTLEHNLPPTFSQFLRVGYIANPLSKPNPQSLSFPSPKFPSEIKAQSPIFRKAQLGHSNCDHHFSPPQSGPNTSQATMGSAQLTIYASIPQAQMDIDFGNRGWK